MTTSPTLADLERKCKDNGLRLTEQRRAVLRILAQAEDHPSVADIHRRVRDTDTAISIATVYRHINALEAAGVIERHSFQSDSARYEMTSGPSHDHLIDTTNGEIVEFRDPAFERLKAEIAETLGYRLVDCRVELYGQRLPDDC